MSGCTLSAPRPPTRRAALAAGLAGLAVAVAACGGGSGSGGSGGDVKLDLTAYSTPADVYADLIPAFRSSPGGQGITFAQSYGASGAQSRAVAAGLPTDIVAFSLAPDVDNLVKPGLVAQGWADNQYKGMVSDSVVVLVVRRGNPKNIRTWDDLTRPGVRIVTPNVLTSGSAKWNVLAAYGAQIKQGRTTGQAVEYLKAFYKNVVSQDKSGRDALQTFASGQGDVLVSYENEAIGARQKGQPVDYVIPDQTILIENPIAVVATSRHSAQATAFVDYLHTAAAQRIFARHGYRPVLPNLVDPRQFPTPPGLFTITDLGGWDRVDKPMFGAGGVVTDILKGSGASAG